MILSLFNAHDGGDDRLAHDGNDRLANDGVADRRSWLPRNVAIALISMLCIIAVGHDMFQTWESRSRQIEESRREVINLASSAARHAEDAFRLADTSLIGVAEQVEAAEPGPGQRERLRRLMSLLVANSSILSDLSVFDETGATVVDALPEAPPVNVADRAFFQYHQTHSDGKPYASRLFRSPFSGKWSVSVTRRVNHAGGDFAGVVTATIDVAYFQGIYAAFDLGHDGVALLLRADGMLLVRQPFLESAVGSDLHGSRLFHDELPRAAGGSFETKSKFDGVTRIIGYHQVSGFPLVATVALGKDEQLATWRANALEHLLAAIAIVSLLGFFAVSLAAQIRLLAYAERAAAAKADQAAAQYHLLAATATEMIVTFDLGFIRRYVSPASRELLGFEPEDMIGKSPEPDFHPEDAERVMACLRELTAGRDRDRIIYRVRHRDGHWVWVEATFTLVRDPDSGAPREVHCALRDAGKQVAAETALIETEERFNLLLQNEGVTDAIYLLDPNGIVETWNAAAERMKGYTAEEIIGQSFATFFTPEDVASGEPERTLGIARDTGRFTAITWRIQKDGRRFQARVTMDAVRGDDGTLRGFAMVAHDTTDEYIGEVQRAIIIEAAPNGMMIVDEAGIITLANSQVARIFGYRKGTLVGQQVEILVPDGFRAAHGVLPSAFTSGDNDNAMSPPRQFTGLKQDGSPVSVEIILNSIATPRGRIVVASMSDVTERLREVAEQQETDAGERLVAAESNARLDRLARHLAEARDRAEQASEAKSRFLTGITHELRTPLHGILGYAELLSLEGDLNLVQSERVATMITAGEHLLGMINAVLDVSQIEADRLDLHPTEFELSEFARACLDVVRPSAVAKGLALVLTVGAPLWVFADSTRLRQVLINLVGNAIKFTPSGTVELRVEPAEAGRRVRLEVADTGPGIWLRHREKLFQTFERLNADSVSGIEGAGVGLSLAARLVEVMGGMIGYVDNPGGGSVFWLELPANRAIPGTAEAAATAPRATRSGLLVLVVDDDALNRSIASGFLRFGGHEVVCVDNGAAAVEAAATQDFDVILMDVRMPGMNGLEATRQIRALPAPRGMVSVVAATAQAYAEQIEICLQAGMNSHVSKPFKQAVLLAAVEDVVRVSDARTAFVRAVPELPVFDRAAFERTVGTLSSEDVGEHVRTLIARGEAALRGLSAPGILARAGDLAEAAHQLAGGAGAFGFLSLAQAGRRFELAADSGAAETVVLADELAAAIVAAIRLMRGELAGMAAVVG
jgi:PAS domain S-box-containing protein